MHREDSLCGRPLFAPGVACENCAFVIAENGRVVIFHDEDSPSEQTPKEPELRSGNLFN